MTEQTFIKIVTTERYSKLYDFGTFNVDNLSDRQRFQLIKDLEGILRKLKENETPFHR